MRCDPRKSTMIRQKKIREKHKKLNLRLISKYRTHREKFSYESRFYEQYERSNSLKKIVGKFIEIKF